MQQTAQRISYETGKPVTYVLGSIRIRQADGSVSAARGVYTENGIIIQADHRYLNIDQIATTRPSMITRPTIRGLCGRSSGPSSNSTAGKSSTR